MKIITLFILFSATGLIMIPGLCSGESKPTLGFVYIGPVGDTGWTFAHEKARLKFDQIHPEITTKAVANVGPDDALVVMENMIKDGCIGIFATSWDYGPAVSKLAEKYPQVHFFHCSGNEQRHNITTYFGRMYETMYLSGALAALMSKTGVIGLICPKVVPETIRHFNAYVLGAQSINPEITVKAGWTGKWYAPGKATQMARELIEKGVDVYMVHDDSAAPLQPAVDAGIYAIGYNANLGTFAPKKILTSAVWNWEIIYEEILQDLLDNCLKGSDIWWGQDKNVVGLTPFSPLVPPDVARKITTLAADIQSGKVAPFTGPVYDSLGKLRIKPGERADDATLLAMDWTVYGLNACLPEQKVSDGVKKVFIVLSYEPDNVCGFPQSNGIEEVLKAHYKDKVVIRKYYMNTKTIHAVPDKMRADAQLVLGEIDMFQPDIVFVVDDNAFTEIGLKLIGRPYPVVFSGMNGDPVEYNTIKPFLDKAQKPCKNITGIREVPFVRATEKTFRQVLGKLDKVAIVTDQSPTGRAVQKQLRKQKQGPENAKRLYFSIGSLADLKETLEKINNDPTIDAILPIVFSLKNDSGEHVDLKVIFKYYLELSKKPDISISLQLTQIGFLGGVSADFKVMGRQAGEMGLKLLSGETIKNVPIETSMNYFISYNTTRARMLGVSIPDELIAAAIIFEGFPLLKNNGKSK